MTYIPSSSHCPDCGKLRYLSRKNAKIAAAHNRGKGKGAVWRAYKCGDFWHLTTESTSRITYFREKAHDVSR